MWMHSGTAMLTHSVLETALLPFMPWRTTGQASSVPPRGSTAFLASLSLFEFTFCIISLMLIVLGTVFRGWLSCFVVPFLAHSEFGNFEPACCVVAYLVVEWKIQILLRCEVGVGV